MVMRISGPERQLTEEEEQVAGTEVQEPRVPDTVLPRIELPEKREPPPPVTPRAPLPSPGELAALQAAQWIFGVPVLKLDRYNGSEQSWQELIRWDIPAGRTGDLHEISVLSDLDDKTRYRIVLGNIDQNIPTDKPTSTPWEAPWRHTVIPGGTRVSVEVRSTDGTTITVYGMLSGTVR